MILAVQYNLMLMAHNYLQDPISNINFDRHVRAQHASKNISPEETVFRIFKTCKPE